MSAEQIAYARLLEAGEFEREQFYAHAESQLVCDRAVARYVYVTSAKLTEQRPYMASLGLDALPLIGLRQDTYGRLVVPQWRDKMLVGIQVVAANGAREEIPDPTGHLMGERTFVLGPDITTLTVLCVTIEDGWCALRALPDARIVVCFDHDSRRLVRRNARGTVAFADNVYARFRELCEQPSFDRWATKHSRQRAALGQIRRAIMMSAEFVAGTG